MASRLKRPATPKEPVVMRAELVQKARVIANHDRKNIGDYLESLLDIKQIGRDYRRVVREMSDLGGEG